LKSTALTVTEYPKR